jgi:murein DD-endopeptidase MepM/ murein hydrolase activator NlpD
VKVRHRNGYVSYYAHLSRYASGLRVGDQVEQKQVIGYVGSSGLSTGPHVCFRMRKDGRYVNPAELKTGSKQAVPQELIPSFAATRDMLLAELDGGAMVASGVSQTGGVSR